MAKKCLMLPQLCDGKGLTKIQLVVLQKLANGRYLDA